jgi:predicted acylesterase/phospholipase RssA
MTGGVSLAVWMGGVTLELDRLRRAVTGSVYTDLCHLVGLRPVVDIVAGTSAGGLNGTLLASATAWESNLEDLRSVWLRAADMAALLRSPGAAAPPSLLDGDGYFLPQTRQALADLRTKGAAPDNTGAAREKAGLPPVHLRVTSTLLFGNTVSFTDTLGEPVNSTTYLGLYSFTTERPASTERPATFDEPSVVDQLARAARSSASFPLAFEASRVDTGAGAVDMAPVADFAKVGDPAATRYVLDGGLVANEPMDEVYDLIRDQPSAGPVRRVICFVSPLSGGDDAPVPPPAFGAPAPDLLEVISATLLIPREQSIVRQLRTILDRSDDHRALSRARRILTITPDVAPDLLRAAEVLRPMIDQQRGQVALAGEIDAGKAAADLADATAAGSREARRQALLIVQDLLRRAVTRATDGDLAALAAEREAVSTALASDLDRDEPVREVVGAAYAQLTAHVPSVKAQVAASPAPDEPVDLLSADLSDLQALVGAAELAGTRAADAPWRAVRGLDVLLTASSSSLTPNPQRIDMVQFSANTPNCFDDRSTAAAKLTGVQFNHFGAFYRGGWRASDWMWGRLDGSMRIVELLVDPDALLATGTPVPQLAAQLYEIACGPPGSPDRVWLSQRPELSGGVEEIEELFNAVAEGRPAADRRAAVLLARRRIARMVAARVQLQILRDELRVVGTYIAADRQAGAAATYDDTVFLEAAKQLADQAPASTVVEVFRACQVGLDRIKDELGSDRMTTLSTQAMAVGTGAVEAVADARGFDVVRPVLTVVRWALRLANSLTSTGFRGSQLAKTAIPMIAVLTAALMAIAVWDDRSALLQLVLGLVLAGLSVAALLTSAGSGGMVLAAVGVIVVLVGGLLLVTVDWSFAPYAGTALAVLAAAVLAALILRHRRPRAAPTTPARDTGPGQHV